MKTKILIIVMLVITLIFTINSTYSTITNGLQAFPEFNDFNELETVLGYNNSNSGLNVTGDSNRSGLTLNLGAENTYTSVTESTYYYKNITLGFTSTLSGTNNIVIDVGFNRPLEDVNALVISSQYNSNNYLRTITYRKMTDSSFPYHYVFMFYLDSFTGWTNGLQFLRVYYHNTGLLMGTPTFYQPGSTITVARSIPIEWNRRYNELITEDDYNQYLQAYTNGYEVGKADGYTQGVNYGYQWGYDVGFIDGQNGELDTWSLLWSAFTTPFAIFEIEALPGVTFGMIALIPLVLGLIAFIFSLGGKKK